MKPFVVLTTLLLASTCSASLYGAVSTQFYTQDHLGQYSYGYADPNSQKHEVRSHDGTTKGSYSYVDGSGHVQSVSYIADPHSGFHASGTNLPQGPAPNVVAHIAPLAYAGYAGYAAPYAHGPAHITLTPQGVPVDTPEVQHAKAAHFAAHAAAGAGHPHHLYKRSLYGYAPQHVPVIHNGVPVETPEVQHAKAAHFAAHAKALSQAGPIGPAGYGAPAAAYHGGGGGGYSGPAYHGPIHIPVISNGVPVEPPEVQHARASHLSALAEASSRAGPYHGGDDGSYWDGAGAGHGGYGPGGPALHGPIHIPVIHNGVPVDTPEVQHARAAHLAALSEASARGGGGYAHGHGYDDGSYHGHGW